MEHVMENVRKKKEDSQYTFFHVFDCETHCVVMRSSNIFEPEDEHRIKVAPDCQVWSRKDNHWVIDVNQS